MIEISGFRFLIMRIQLFFIINPPYFILQFLFECFLFISFVSNFLLFYIESVADLTPFYNYNYFTSIDDYFLNTNSNREKNFLDNYNNSGGNNNNNDNSFFSDYDHKKYNKPLPKKYYLPSGDLISGDGDSFSHHEIQKRIYCTKIIKFFNTPVINHSLVYYENYTLAKNSMTFFNILTNTIFTPQHNNISLYSDTPITPVYKFYSSIIWASAQELKYNLNSYLYDIPYPDNNFAQIVNASSPYNISTFSKNDTWNDKILANMLIKQWKYAITPKFLSNLGILIDPSISNDSNILNNSDVLGNFHIF